ncbi:hypothetical protein BZA05DRAFT_261787 [Tricharina praecox]|uniref:uncharacterized protein n=1 Tax=Tricharina praecox TaxID=43433 RepID=UPI00221F82FF|nr:uncharacterized protein BZA05DRAFT_261787 [Tricharina praecox]KAI5854275.1 hypothetical protein BZA05DRAFT_261787 [Tricharina praecox]
MEGEWCLQRRVRRVRVRGNLPSPTDGDHDVSLPLAGPSKRVETKRRALLEIQGSPSPIPPPPRAEEVGINTTVRRSEYRYAGHPRDLQMQSKGKGREGKGREGKGASRKGMGMGKGREGREEEWEVKNRRHEGVASFLLSGPATRLRPPEGVSRWNGVTKHFAWVCTGGRGDAIPTLHTWH